MYKSALLAVKPSSTHSRLVDFALEFATRHELELASVSIVDADRVAPPEPVPLGGGAFKKEKDERLLAAAREAADRAVTACQSACARGGVPCQAVACEGDTVGQLSRRVAEHDLLVVGHSAGKDTGDGSLLLRILKHSPRPALVVPREPRPGSAVVVAYDGSLQAVRTLAAFAHSGLASGRAVHVVSYDDEPARAAERIALACRFLERHGIVAAVHVSEREVDVAKALLEKAADLSAGLLVMGAFGKPAALEYVLGSVTRSILQDPFLPVLLDH